MLSLLFLFFLLLFFHQLEKFGIAIGETVYFFNGRQLQTQFPLSFDFVVETEKNYFFVLLYLFCFWEGMEKCEKWSLKENNRLHYSHRGITIKLHYIPSHPIRVKRGKLFFRDRRKVIDLGKRFPVSSHDS